MLQAPTLPLGAADCESAGTGWLLQPANAWSSLAFAVVGIVLIVSASQTSPRERSLRIPFGVLMAATGIGSFLYHGPQSGGAGFVHDITFLAMLWFLILVDPASAYGVPLRLAWAALGMIVLAGSIVLIAVPASTNVLTGISVFALIGTDVLMHRIGGIDGAWYGAAVLLFAGSLVFNLLGRSGTASCDPDSLFQLHALWHVSSAAAIGAYFVAMTVPRNQESRT